MGLCPSSPLSVIPEVMTLTRYFTMLYGNFWDPPLQNMITTLCCGHHFRALSPFYSLKIAKKKTKSNIESVIICFLVIL